MGGTGRISRVYVAGGLQDAGAVATRGIPANFAGGFDARSQLAVGQQVCWNKSFSFVYESFLLHLKTFCNYVKSASRKDAFFRRFL